MDEQIMSWAVQRPEDWQLGGRCEALMWGGGRIGQLGEAGRAVLTPTAAQSFSCAQQVAALSFQSSFCFFPAPLQDTALSYRHLSEG